MLLVHVIIKNNMPYRIVKRNTNDGRPYKIIKVDTGKVVGSSKTMNDAKASIRARYANE